MKTALVIKLIMMTVAFLCGLPLQATIPKKWRSMLEKKLTDLEVKAGSKDLQEEEAVLVTPAVTSRTRKIRKWPNSMLSDAHTHTHTQATCTCDKQCDSYHSCLLYTTRVIISIQYTCNQAINLKNGDVCFYSKDTIVHVPRHEMSHTWKQFPWTPK